MNNEEFNKINKILHKNKVGSFFLEKGKDDNTYFFFFTKIKFWQFSRKKRIKKAIEEVNKISKYNLKKGIIKRKGFGKNKRDVVSWSERYI